MLLQYILKLSISLSVVYLFYQLLLRRLTFYTLNRWYLVVYSLLCFVIPFINVFTFIKEPALQQSTIIGYIPALEEYTNAHSQRSALSFNWMNIITAVIVIGMAGMMIRLLIQYYSLFKIRSQAILLHNDKVKLYHIDKPVIPFSFGKAIFVNQHQHNEDELKEIIRHEFIHVKQRHSLDILWSELLCIVNWYNPFAWLLRKDIRQNLEFIADQQVLQTGLDRKQYQYLLLKVIGVNAFSIASNFNFSSLKKRIAMMNKTKSAKVHLIRFLFILPLLVVVVLAFRNTAQQQQQVLRTSVTDTVPTKGGVQIPPADLIDFENKQDGHRILTMSWKNGAVEKYDLNDPKDREAFKNKYGHELPEPPVPPTPPVPQIVTGTDLNKIMSLDLSNNKATVTLKDGTVEKYDLKNPKEKKVFESKYADPHEPNEAPEPPANAAEPPAPPAPPAVSLHEVRVVSDGAPNPKLAVDAKPVTNASAPTVAVDAKPVTKVHVQSEPVTIVNLKPVAAGEPERVTVKDSRARAIDRVVLTDTTPNRVMVLDNFQNTFEDPKHLPSEIIGLIHKTDTENQLKELQKNMKNRGYKLELDNTTYVNGALANVIAKVSTRGGEEVSFSATDFDNVLLIESQEKNGKYAGFHIVIKTGSKNTMVR